MEQMILKAVTTATDEGTFTAVISTASVDREKDIVSPGGMVRALQKWANTGKKIPLAWNHSGDPDLQIGYIDPHSAKQVGTEVQVSGWIDQAIDAGAHAWRLVKAGTLGFSFGYLILQGSNRKGGGRNIDELDVFEATATPTPMNNDTRILSYKAMTVGDLASIDDPTEILNLMITMAQSYINHAPDTDAADGMQGILDDLQDCAAGDDGDDMDGKALRRRADMVALEHLIDGESHRPRSKQTPQPADMPAGAEWLFPAAELKAVRDGEIKAAWTTSYVNDLPDSAFLYIASGGTKDSDGKTIPRSNRYFPVKDANGAVDLPHLRNALARIPQSDLSQSVKDAATAKAQHMLDASKSVDESAKETKSRAVDPLRVRADAVALEVASAGESRRKPPAQKAARKPEPALTLSELRQRTRDETLKALSGVDEI